jgi:hypothetical protein
MADDNIVVNTENDAEMMTSTPCNITWFYEKSWPELDQIFLSPQIIL